MKTLVTVVIPDKTNMLNEVIHVSAHSAMCQAPSKYSINIATIGFIQRNVTEEGELGLEYRSVGFESKTFSFISLPSLPITH